MNHPKFQGRRARTNSWLETNDQDEIVSRRPVSQRIMFGFSAGAMLWLTCKATPNLLPLLSDSAAYGAAALIMYSLILLTFCFLVGAGPRRLHFDLQRGEYSLRQGILFLAWTKHGQIAESEITLSRTKSGCFALIFKAQCWRYGLPFEFVKEREEANFLAREIADKLGVEPRCEAIRQ